MGDFCRTCPTCGNLGLCRSDCPVAPWNQDRPSTTRFAYMLRKRRWAKHPIDGQEEWPYSRRLGRPH